MTRPNDYEIKRAAEFLDHVIGHLTGALDYHGEAQKQAAYETALLRLEDALGFLGLEYTPPKTQPQATADAIYDASDYAAGRGF
jgi:hypothetical protein